MKTLMFHSAARAELKASIDFYESRRKGLGVRFLDCVDAAVRQARQHPEAGSPLGSGFRKWIVPGFPYSLIYRVWKDRIYVTAVAHQHRRPGYWMSRIPGPS